MRLTAAHVQHFKSITDSSVFTLDEHVTALVGKNESGKTAVLEAMYRLNPLSSGHHRTFEELRDYPRRYRARDRDKIAETEPVSLTFALEDADRAAVAEAYGPHAVALDYIVVSRRYGSDKTWWRHAADVPAVIRYLVEKAGLDPDRYAKDTVKATTALLREDEDAMAAVELASSIEDRDLSADIRAALELRLPTFQYFDEYNTLPGAVSIRRLQSEDENSLDPGERTALALLRLAGVESQEFSEGEYEARKAALEAAANQLTDELFEYWTQNKDLSVELDIEFRPQPHNGMGSPPTPDPWLQIRVRNQRHRVTLNMAERSKGFIWFFSFLAAFSEYAAEARRIILLDEPGLNLHAKAQGDLLRFIDERVAPYHQVVYSTHSLFMVAPTSLDRIRTVEDLDNVGTKVSEDVWAARPDTVFPILGALGVDMTQTLVIGADQLVVEGPADVVYLTVMSDVVRRAGGIALDPRWTLTPVGGLDKIPTFVSLLGATNLNVTVLMDVAAGGNQKISSLVSRGLLNANRLVPLTEFTGTAEADIEDLFDPDWYVNLLNAAGIGLPGQLPEGARIVKRVEVALGARYDHYQPANHLLRSGGPLLDEIDDAARDRFAALFTRLNGLLR